MSIFLYVLLLCCQAFTFTGASSVTVTVNGDGVMEIVLHSLDTDISSAIFFAPGGAPTAATAITYQKDKFQTATFAFAAALPPGPGTLKLTFTGVLNDKVCLVARGGVRVWAKLTSSNLTS
jgi:hypothetical protein